MDAGEINADEIRTVIDLIKWYDEHHNTKLLDDPKRNIMFSNLVNKTNGKIYDMLPIIYCDYHKFKNKFNKFTIDRSKDFTIQVGASVSKKPYDLKKFVPVAKSAYKKAEEQISPIVKKNVVPTVQKHVVPAVKKHVVPAVKKQSLKYGSYALDFAKGTHKGISDEILRNAHESLNVPLNNVSSNVTNEKKTNNKQTKYEDTLVKLPNERAHELGEKLGKKSVNALISGIKTYKKQQSRDISSDSSAVKNMNLPLNEMLHTSEINNKT